MIMELNTLIENAIKSAIDYGVAAYEVVENSRKTNRLYDKNFKYFKELKSLGNNGIVELEKLLDHPNDYVKYSSAVHLLSVKEEKAKHVLSEFASKPNLFGLSVETLLMEWDKGELREYLS